MKQIILALMLSVVIARAQQPVAPGQIHQVSGPGDTLVTTTGPQTPNTCVYIDTSGNHVSTGLACSVAIGAVGPAGQSVTVTAESAGSNCTYAGFKLVSASGTSYVCNGSPGATGPAGSTGAAGSSGVSVTVTTEPPGSNCANGGQKLVSASGTAYVCNGGTGGGGTYTADGTTVVLTGSQFGANTAVLATRETVRGGDDTTCVMSSSSPTAYVCAMKGLPTAIVYADGMRILAEVNITATGNVTLDAGAGARNVYQYGGITRAGASDFVVGGHVLMSYDGTLSPPDGGWRILSGGGTTYTPPAPQSSAVFLPFGGIYASASTVGLLSSANQVAYMPIYIPAPGLALSGIKVFATTAGNAGAMAFALYDKTCALLATSSTVTGNGTQSAIDFAISYSAAGGAYYLAFSSDDVNGGKFFSASNDFDGYYGFVINAGESSSTYKLFRGSNASTTTAGVTSFPSTCGSTRTAFATPGVRYLSFAELH